MYDAKLLNEILDDAAINTPGEHYVERRALEMFVPTILSARQNGMSFVQLTEHLNRCGLALDVGSVRALYSEVLMHQFIESATQINEKIEAFTRGETIPEPDNHDGQRCLPLRTCVKQLERRDGVPEAVYQEGLLEHPAIKGLMLTKGERLYGSHLEIIDGGGQERFETDLEKRFRIKWQKPIPMFKRMY